MLKVKENQHKVELTFKSSVQQILHCFSYETHFQMQATYQTDNFLLMSIQFSLFCCNIIS